MTRPRQVDEALHSRGIVMYTTAWCSNCRRAKRVFASLGVPYTEVIYPMAEVRGLQLARNDKAAASGLMTEARQDRSPAACAPSGAYVKHFTLATLPASNAGMFGWEGAMCKPFAPSVDGVPKHRSSLPQHERAALTPMPQGRGLCAGEGQHQGGSTSGRAGATATWRHAARAHDPLPGWVAAGRALQRVA
jgi:glutaredoxin